MQRSKSFLLPVFLLCCGILDAQYLTYNSDIKPIIDKNCKSCHRPDDIGPMPLTNYEEVSAYGKMIQYVTASRQMPPWYADPSYRHFSNERILTDDEIDKIGHWVTDGMNEGALPYGQVISSAVSVTVLPREADLVIPMREAFEQYGIYLDQYQVFVLRTNLTEDKWVEGIDFVPGNKKIVRHAAISISPAGQFDSLDQWDPRYGYYSFGGLGKIPDQPFWYTWSPQQEASFFTDGHLKFLPKGSDLILHIHYGPTGKPQLDSSMVRLYFSDQKPNNQLITAPLINPYSLTNGTFYIPSETKKIFHADYTLPYAIELRSLTPQANLLCRSFEVYAKRPGESQPVRLLKIKDWNFNWKQTYKLESPVILPAGTVIHALANYDNTPDNPCNPSDKPKEVYWGAHLFNEMFFVHFEFAPVLLLRSATSIVAPTTAGKATMPVRIEGDGKGYYSFQVRKINEEEPSFKTDILLSGEKQLVNVPIASLANDNYVLEVLNTNFEIVARHMFVKMWDKGL